MVMSDSIHSALRVITDELAALQEKRDVLAAEIEEIDGKLARIADQLGVKLPGTVSLPRLTAQKAHPRFAGSMPEAMMKFLLEADKGYSRAEVKAALRDGPNGETIRKNENTYYNAVKRYIQTGKIVEINGLLYHPDRAPTEASDADRTDSLPENVTLFTSKKTAADQ